MEITNKSKATTPWYPGAPTIIVPEPNSDVDLLLKLLYDNPELLQSLSDEVKEAIKTESGQHFELVLKKV
jgi:hypothetical protein